MSEFFKFTSLVFRQVLFTEKQYIFVKAVIHVDNRSFGDFFKIFPNQFGRKSSHDLC